MPLRLRLAVITAFFAIAAGLIVYGSMDYLRQDPSNVNFTQGHASGQPVNLTVQTVGTIGFGSHPSWVSYLVKGPSGQWIHSTLWQLPAHTLINVTLYQFDSGSPLRNQAYGLVTGTNGGGYSLNGHFVRVLDSDEGAGVAHTFTVPDIGINVPLWGVSSNAKNPCSAAPCPLSASHNTVKFSFTTPGPGQYRWQCFIPCGLSYVDGNGGPMQTIGYMGGFLKVLA